MLFPTDMVEKLPVSHGTKLYAMVGKDHGPRQAETRGSVCRAHACRGSSQRDPVDIDGTF